MEVKRVDWLNFLRITHVLGTVLGVGGSTFAEIFYIKFLKDAKIDELEHGVLSVCYRVVRLGLIILVLSGFGLFVLHRLNMDGPGYFYSPKIMAKMLIVLILVFVAMLTNLRLINLSIGSALATSSWYAAAILGTWRRPQYSLIEFLLGYVVVTVFVYFLLHYLRRRFAK